MVRQVSTEGKEAASGALVATNTLDRFKTIRKLFKKPAFTSTFHVQRDSEFKRVIHTFDAKRFKTLEVLHLTDVQFGHICCNIPRMIEYRDWVLDKPNRFMLWGGDMIDAGTKVSVGSPWEQLWEPQGQLYRFAEIWAPARHRVLGYVGGNHERRGSLTFGDLGQAIATVLEIPYSAGQQLVDINYGEHQAYRVHLWHGGGAAVTAGAKMQMLSRFMERGDSQLYLVGHLHEPMVRFYARPLRQADGGIKLIKVGGAMSSSFLEYYGSYAEVANLSSAPLMMARVILEPNGHWELTLR